MQLLVFLPLPISFAAAAAAACCNNHISLFGSSILLLHLVTAAASAIVFAKLLFQRMQLKFYAASVTNISIAATQLHRFICCLTTAPFVSLNAPIGVLSIAVAAVVYILITFL